MTSLPQHWEAFIFQMCSILAIYNLLADEPDEEDVKSLEDETVFEEANKVFVRAVQSTEAVLQEEELEEQEPN